MIEEKISFTRLVWTYFTEWLNPSEGEYTLPGPSGLGSWYMGPPLRARVQRRLHAYYSQKPNNLTSIDYRL